MTARYLQGNNGTNTNALCMRLLTLLNEGQELLQICHLPYTACRDQQQSTLLEAVMKDLSLNDQPSIQHFYPTEAAVAL